MTDKPSQWAMDVWEKARGVYFEYLENHEDAARAIEQAFEKRESEKREDALRTGTAIIQEIERKGREQCIADIFDKARQQWEAEICEWLRVVGNEPAKETDTGQALARKISCDFFAAVIERGEYRKDKP